MNYQSIKLKNYNEQVKTWPTEGRHILAQYDDTSIIVYQAYRPAIGEFAAKHGYFGGPFSLNRMSWIKPNFLWMMYRCSWATKQGQEIVLAIRLKRTYFDDVLAKAVPSFYDSQMYENQKDWQKAVKRSSVRRQWDPDHNPSGHKQSRRAIQLGLRGDMLAEYAKSAILEIIDISAFVREQYGNFTLANYELLSTPEERVYVSE